MEVASATPMQPLPRLRYLISSLVDTLRSSEFTRRGRFVTKKRAIASSQSFSLPRRVRTVAQDLIVVFPVLNACGSFQICLQLAHRRRSWSERFILAADPSPLQVLLPHSVLSAKRSHSGTRLFFYIQWRCFGHAPQTPSARYTMALH